MAGPGELVLGAPGVGVREPVVALPSGRRPCDWPNVAGRPKLMASTAVTAASFWLRRTYSPPLERSKRKRVGCDVPLPVVKRAYFCPAMNVSAGTCHLRRPISLGS